MEPQGSILILILGAFEYKTRDKLYFEIMGKPCHNNYKKRIYFMTNLCYTEFKGGVSNDEFRGNGQAD